LLSWFKLISLFRLHFEIHSGIFINSDLLVHFKLVGNKS
jgi:hypothetical protein